MKKNLLCIAKKIALLHVIMGGGVCYVLGMNSNNNPNPNFIPGAPIQQNAPTQPGNLWGQPNLPQPSMQQPQYGAGQPGWQFPNNMPNSQTPQYGAGQPGGLPTYSGPENITNSNEYNQQSLMQKSGYTQPSNNQPSLSSSAININDLIRRTNTIALNKKKNNIVQRIQTNLSEVDQKINGGKTYKARAKIYNTPGNSGTGGSNPSSDLSGSVKYENDTQILSLQQELKKATAQISELKKSYMELERALESAEEFRKDKEKIITELEQQLKTQTDEAKKQIRQGFYNSYTDRLLQQLSVKTSTYNAPGTVEWARTHYDKFHDVIVDMNARVQEYNDVMNNLSRDLCPATQKEVDTWNACTREVLRVFTNFSSLVSNIQDAIEEDASDNDEINQNNSLVSPPPAPVTQQPSSGLGSGGPSNMNIQNS